MDSFLVLIEEASAGERLVTHLAGEHLLSLVLHSLVLIQLFTGIAAEDAILEATEYVILRLLLILGGATVLPDHVTL